MFDGAFELRGTGDVFAAPRDKFRIAIDWAAACGTFVRHLEMFFLAGAFGGDGFDDFGNDHPGFADDDGVADADVFAFDFFFVVQRGAGDGRALDKNRFEFGDGREDAGAANLDGDAEELGLGRFDPVLRACRRWRNRGALALARDAALLVERS